MTLDEKLALAVEVIKAEKLALKSLVPYMVSSRVSTAAADQAQTREIASEVAPLVSLGSIVSTFTSEDSAVPKSFGFLDSKPWSVGMKTNPGDIVLDPLGEYAYLYTGTEAMTHSNPMFYPGAAGVYYWAIIPRVKNSVKVYPDVEGIIVAVKQGEKWWNTDQTQIFAWKGVDNPNCVWPPVEGNEWELVQPETE